MPSLQFKGSNRHISVLYENLTHLERSNTDHRHRHNSNSAFTRDLPSKYDVFFK